MRWYYGWNVLAVGVAFQAVLFGFTVNSFTLWATEWVKEFDAPRGDIMIGVTIWTIVQGLMAPFAGKAMDRSSIRLLVTAGSVATVLGLAAISQLDAVWQILVVYCTLIAFGTLLAGPLAAQTLAAKWFRGRRGFAVGISTIGTSIGGFLMPPLVTMLFLDVGWRDAHLILAGIALVTIIPVVWLVVRNDPEEMGIEPDPETEVSAARSASRVFPEWTTWTILKERNFWIMIVAFVPMVTALASIQHNLSPLASDSGIEPQEASYLVSLMLGSAAVSKLFFGLVTDRWDLRTLFWMANVSIGLAICLFLADPGYALMLLASALLGLGAGGFLPLLAALVSTRFGPRSFGRVMGLVGPFTLIAGFGPWAAGWLRDNLGTYELALQMSLAILLPAVAVMVLLRPLAAVAQSNLAGGRPAA
ncbi:MAG: MFS transporter [Sphingomonadales bacterium]